MAREDHRSLAQKWHEYWGRRREPPQIAFGETSILTQPAPFMVGALLLPFFPGCYLSLPPMTAAIVTSNTGEKMVFVQGGYKELPDGAYTLQYVDLRERTFNFPAIIASTMDGSKVSLTISINYKVNDPLEIANVAKPLDALLTACESAIKKFITTHSHHEIIGEPGSQPAISDDEIIDSIKQQVTHNQACQAFELLDVVLKERYGDPKVSALKQEYLVQEKKSAIEREGLIQQQEIAEEQKRLAIIKAECEQLLQELQAQTEARRSEILEPARRLSVELEYLQSLPEMQYLKLETLGKALEALIRTQTIAGFPRDANDTQLLKNILSALAEGTRNLPQIPPEKEKPASESKSTIINLLSPPKKKKGK